MNSVDSKYREYSSNFSSSPYKKKLYFEKKFLKFGLYFYNYLFADHAPGLRYMLSIIFALPWK